MTNVTADFIDDDDIQEDDNDFDIIIVGAGLCGLVCAYNILKKATGLDVLIIEANNEIGGRILSKDCNESFHISFLQKHITDIINVLNIKIRRKQDFHDKERMYYTTYRPRQYLPRFFGAEVFNFLQTVENGTADPRFDTYTAHEDAPQLAETSVEQLLNKIVFFSYARTLCRAFICTVCATRNLNNVSALWLLVMLNGASGFINRLKVAMGDNNRYFIQGGVTTIAQELLKRILQQQGNIRYEEPVSKIIFNDDRAYVITNKTSFKCRFVVVAVPPPLHSDIDINPFLEPFSNAHTIYTPSENVFFNIVYKKSLLSDNIKTNIITSWDSNTNLNILYEATLNSMEQILLAGFLAESNATQTHKKDLFNTLNECFQTTNSLRYEKYKEFNYTSPNDQLTSGVPMSILKPTSISNHVNCIDELYGRIFFASSEYATNWPGTIDGAVEAGEDAAYSILLRIRPQSLTFKEIDNLTSKRKVRTGTASFKMSAFHYLGLILNVAIFASFLRYTYSNNNNNIDL